ncbi:MAG: hypothetical protein ABI624_23810 [Casimicrobiaceae bacterium]
MRHDAEFLLLGADAVFVAERVVHESDGPRIVDFLAYPKGEPEGVARLPCVLFDCQGNREFGAHTPPARPTPPMARDA